MGKVIMAVWMSAASGQLRRDETATLVLNGDGWTLLDQRLINRMLFTQLKAQDYRLAVGDRWAFGANVETGTQVPRPGSVLGAWHGYAITDLYGTAYITDGLEVSLNLTTYSMGASYGYRSRIGVLPGIALHASGHWGPLKTDLLATDLGLVTVGRGLLFEKIDLEGSWVD